ncbi:hypothetical protein BS50DRAFT_627870 [Corynespora cassiicola Philippines]|uniref:Uncharacterized protein n=1 Tax=Corynespora cassiicola Philippines TaxID=1448308 RepID=A0A2T2PA75_CORCC|nr:hypothetical protein BS50DRAFT_627870 [Corynespora cassiicola Philippines]
MSSADESDIDLSASRPRRAGKTSQKHCGQCRREKEEREDKRRLEIRKYEKYQYEPLIKNNVLQLQQFDDLISNEEAGGNWRALLELMQRPWFSRRWKISSSKFAVAVELFVEVETATHRLSEVMKKSQRDKHVPGLFEHVSALGASLLVNATDRLFRDYKEEHRSQISPTTDDKDSDSGFESESELDKAQVVESTKGNRTAMNKSSMRPVLSLEYLVSTLTIFETSVLHDTIYALLAISKDTTPRAARSYAPESAAYARDGLEDQVTFSRIGDDIVDRRDLPLPSWVPHLSNAPYGMLSQAGIPGLKMSRKNAGPLVSLPGSTQRTYSAAETKSIDTRALRFRKRVDLGHYSMYVRGFTLDRIVKVEEVSRNGQIPGEWAELSGWSDIKEQQPPEAFWRTLVGDRGTDGRNPPVYYSRACKESFLKGGYEAGAVVTSGLINYEQNSVVSQFCWRVQAVIWNKAVVKTEKNRLGLIRNDVKEGDFICVLYALSNIKNGNMLKWFVI